MDRYLDKQVSAFYKNSVCSIKKKHMPYKCPRNCRAFAENFSLLRSVTVEKKRALC